MTRRRMFLDINCVDAARQRIRHVYDTFDTVCVQFSGGKKPIENSNPVTTNKPNPVPKKIFRATVAGVLIISPQYTS